MRTTYRRKTLREDPWLMGMLLVTAVSMAFFAVLYGMRLRLRMKDVPPLSLVKTAYQRDPFARQKYPPELLENAVQYFVQVEPDSLFEVKRSPNLPKLYADEKGCTAYSILRNFPVPLPSRFVEDGFEWRRYHASPGDNGCPLHHGVYIGRPAKSKPDWLYRIDYLPDSDEVKLTLADKHGTVQYEQRLAVFRRYSPIFGELRMGLQPQEYRQELLLALTPFAEKQIGNSQTRDETIFWERGYGEDEWYYWHRGHDLMLMQNEAQLEPMAVAADAHPNVYRFGTGKVDFGPRVMTHVQAWQDSRFFAISYLTISRHDIDKTKPTILPEVHMIVFSKDSLDIESCGERLIPLGDMEKDFMRGSVRIKRIVFQPQPRTCPKPRLVLDNGRILEEKGI